MEVRYTTWRTTTTMKRMSCSVFLHVWPRLGVSGCCFMLWPSVFPLPLSISVSSSGPARGNHWARLGHYRLVTNQTAQDRPVYKKTDRDYYIYYTSKTLLYYYAYAYAKLYHITIYIILWHLHSTTMQMRQAFFIELL